MSIFFIVEAATLPKCLVIMFTAPKNIKIRVDKNERNMKMTSAIKRVRSRFKIQLKIRDSNTYTSFWPWLGNAM